MGKMQHRKICIPSQRKFTRYMRNCPRFHPCSPLLLHSETFMEFTVLEMSSLHQRFLMVDRSTLAKRLVLRKVKSQSCMYSTGEVDPNWRISVKLSVTVLSR